MSTGAVVNAMWFVAGILACLAVWQALELWREREQRRRERGQ